MSYPDSKICPIFNPRVKGYPDQVHAEGNHYYQKAEWFSVKGLHEGFKLRRVADMIAKNESGIPATHFSFRYIYKGVRHQTNFS